MPPAFGLLKLSQLKSLTALLEIVYECFKTSGLIVAKRAIQIKEDGVEVIRLDCHARNYTRRRMKDEGGRMKVESGRWKVFSSFILTYFIL